MEMDSSFSGRHPHCLSRYFYFHPCCSDSWHAWKELKTSWRALNVAWMQSSDACGADVVIFGFAYPFRVSLVHLAYEMKWETWHWLVRASGSEAWSEVAGTA